MCKYVCVCSQLGGPIWSEPTHDAEFVRGLLEEVETHKQDYEQASRIRGLLSVVSEVTHTHTAIFTLLCTCIYIHVIRTTNVSFY